MKLINRCYLKDIRNYEEHSHCNILKLFDDVSVSNIVTLIKIFERVSDEDCDIILNNFLSCDNTLLDALLDIRDELLGRPEEDDIDVDFGDEEEDSGDDLQHYDFLSDYYIDLMLIFSGYGINSKEFWELSTRELYRIHRGVQNKQIADYNKQLQLNYTSAGLIAAAVWGKLPKECPQIQVDDVIDTELGRMKRSVYNQITMLDKLGG